jgi:hypothetical protein
LWADGRLPGVYGSGAQASGRGALMAAQGRWTPEFRAWFNAYYFDHEESEHRLAPLLAAAIEAGERERKRVANAERCRECGRPLVDSAALDELIAFLDGQRPAAV